MRNNIRLSFNVNIIFIEKYQSIFYHQIQIFSVFFYTIHKSILYYYLFMSTIKTSSMICHEEFVFFIDLIVCFIFLQILFYMFEITRLINMYALAIILIFTTESSVFQFDPILNSTNQFIKMQYVDTIFQQNSLEWFFTTKINETTYIYKRVVYNPLSLTGLDTFSIQLNSSYTLIKISKSKMTCVAFYNNQSGATPIYKFDQNPAVNTATQLPYFYNSSTTNFEIDQNCRIAKSNDQVYIFDTASNNWIVDNNLIDISVCKFSSNLRNMINTEGLWIINLNDPQTVSYDLIISLNLMSKYTLKCTSNSLCVCLTYELPANSTIPFKLFIFQIINGKWLVTYQLDDQSTILPQIVTSPGISQLIVTYKQQSGTIQTVYLFTTSYPYLQIKKYTQIKNEFKSIGLSKNYLYYRSITADSSGMQKSVLYRTTDDKMVSSQTFSPPSGLVTYKYSRIEQDTNQTGLRKVIHLYQFQNKIYGCIENDFTVCTSVQTVNNATSDLTQQKQVTQSTTQNSNLVLILSITIPSVAVIVLIIIIVLYKTGVIQCQILEPQDAANADATSQSLESYINKLQRQKKNRQRPNFQTVDIQNSYFESTPGMNKLKNRKENGNILPSRRIKSIDSF